jgi:hypothetical protein
MVRSNLEKNIFFIYRIPLKISSALNTILSQQNALIIKGAYIAVKYDVKCMHLFSRKYGKSLLNKNFKKFYTNILIYLTFLLKITLQITLLRSNKFTKEETTLVTFLFFNLRNKKFFLNFKFYGIILTLVFVLF